MESLPDVYSLTGLQIGDIQSHVSHAFLYIADSSKRLIIMVDNRPWSTKEQPSSYRIWQMMVAKYRISPFTNTLHSNGGHECCIDNSKTSCPRWFHLVDSSKLQEKYFDVVRNLSNFLHGFIVFEVAWKDVHGMNYLNELQNDTNLALEVTTMKKWEFFDPEHASSCISLWFSDCTEETQPLKDYLTKLTDIDRQKYSSQAPPNTEVSSSDDQREDEFSDVQEILLEPEDIDTECCDAYNVGKSLCTLCTAEDQRQFLMSIDEAKDGCISPTCYSNTLVLFRFNDSLLPFKLKEIIVADIRLLTLLESGLPSWVIFLQSYPLFCNLYHPWMRLLARAIQVLISFATVLIGFYDLYKNVPLLKDTAGRIFGPLVDWIETWDVATRLRYLGTMIFLQNLRKSFNWLFALARTTKVILSTISRPLFGPIAELIRFISPFWNEFAEIFEIFSSTFCSLVSIIYTEMTEFADVFMWPFEILYTYACAGATFLYPIFHGIWELLRHAARFLVTIFTCFQSVLLKLFNLIRDGWGTVRSSFELSSLPEAPPSGLDNSALKQLWNDLLSRIFGALRGIINGFATFFIACNRHRLSLYNHARAFVHRLSLSISLKRPHQCRCKEANRQENSNEEEEVHLECDRCK